MAITALDHLVITCRDVEASADWYVRVLGMERAVFGAQQRVSLRFGAQKINLRPAEATQDAWFTGVAAAPGTQDLCFLADSPAEHNAEALQSLGVPVEVGPATKDGALGPIRSVYCRDPDGNLIEIACYADALPD